MGVRTARSDRPGARLLIVVLLGVIVLAGCTSTQGFPSRPGSSADSVSSSAGPAGSTTQALAAALATVPAGTAEVGFYDQATLLRRWDIRRPVRATDTETFQRYVAASRDFSGVDVGSLPLYVQSMLTDGAGVGWTRIGRWMWTPEGTRTA